VDPGFRTEQVLSFRVTAGASAWLMGFLRGEVLDVSSVEDGVATLMTESYGETNVDGVDCPARQPITTGHEFTCDASLDGEMFEVPIRVLNDNPEFEVGAPK
jgi:hypothetical protein